MQSENVDQKNCISDIKHHFLYLGDGNLIIRCCGTCNKSWMFHSESRKWVLIKDDAI